MTKVLNDCWLTLRGVSPRAWSHVVGQEPQKIGRTSSCDIRILHDSVSREHAVIWLSDSEIWIRDLNSRNGTFCGEKRIDECRITSDKTLRIGRVAVELKASNLEDVPTAELGEMPTQQSTKITGIAEEAAIDQLSEAQVRVLRVMLTGKSEKEIASQLHKSPHTIHSHIREIYRHYGVSSRAELMASFINNALTKQVSG